MAERTKEIVVLNTLLKPLGPFDVHMVQAYGKDAKDDCVHVLIQGVKQSLIAMGCHYAGCITNTTGDNITVKLPRYCFMYASDFPDVFCNLKEPEKDTGYFTLPIEMKKSRFQDIILKCSGDHRLGTFREAGTQHMVVLTREVDIVSQIYPTKEFYSLFSKSDVPVIKPCVVCKDHTKPTKLCSGCKVFNYCSVECQKAHWPEHKSKCNKAKVYNNLK